MKFDNIKSEGSLLSYDLLTEIYKGEAKGQKPIDFGIKESITDEISASWSDVLSFWDSFQRSMRRLNDNQTSTKITRERFVIPLLETLGFKHIKYYT
jgi:predicted metal-dependent phosphotriesterase family hydrolase